MSHLSYYIMGKTQFIKRVITLFTVVFVFIISTAGSCGSSTDSRPSLSSTYPEKWDVQLDPVFLRYDMAKFINDCQQYGSIYPAADIQDLADYNNVTTSSGWLDFYTLFNNTENYSGPGAEAKFIFTQSDCSGSITVSYNNFDDKLCNYNIISNAPKISKTHLVEFSAHTIKTLQNNIFIKWNKAYTANGFGTYLNIDLQGTVDYPNYLFTTGTKGGNQVAARIIEDRFVLVENTISSDMQTGQYKPILVDETPLVSNTLKQDVYISGSVNKNLKWSVPVIVELESI